MLCRLAFICQQKRSRAWYVPGAVWTLLRVQHIGELDGGKRHQRTGQGGRIGTEMLLRMVICVPSQSGASLCSPGPASAVQGQCLQSEASVCPPSPVCSLGPASAVLGQCLQYEASIFSTGPFSTVFSTVCPLGPASVVQGQCLQSGARD